MNDNIVVVHHLAPSIPLRQCGPALMTWCCHVVAVVVVVGQQMWKAVAVSLSKHVMGHGLTMPTQCQQ